MRAATMHPMTDILASDSDGSASHCFSDDAGAQMERLVVDFSRMY